MSNRKFILSIVVIIAVNVFTIRYFNPDTTDNHNEIIIGLEKENVRLENENSRLDTLLLKKHKTSDSLTKKLDQNKRIIQNLHYEIQEKINVIGTMSDLELYRYFSNIRTDQADHRK